MGASNSEQTFSKFDKLVSPSAIRRAQLHYLRVFGTCPGGEVSRRPFGSSGCVITVAAGTAHSLAVLADGQVYSWGSNTVGQLGHGTQGSRIVTAPCKVPLVKTVVVRVAAGGAHSVAVTETGQLFSWGQGNEGQLGYEVRTSTHCQLTPRQVMGLNDELADEVACGGEFTAVLTVSGRVLTFGCGRWGALGQGALGSSSRPMPILGAEGKRFLHISAGRSHCLAITQEGGVFEWGTQYYALNNKQDIIRTAQNVALPVSAVSIACGDNHSVVLCCEDAESYLVFTWGCNDHGQLGYFYSDEDNTHRVPRRVEGILGVPVTVAAGKAYTAVLMLSGEIYGWGSNSAGQFGSQPFLEAPTPVVVAPSSEQKVASLAAGPDHLLLLFQADYSYSCQTFLEGLGPSEAATSFVYASFARPE